MFRYGNINSEMAELFLHICMVVVVGINTAEGTLLSLAEIPQRCHHQTKTHTTHILRTLAAKFPTWMKTHMILAMTMMAR